MLTFLILKISILGYLRDHTMNIMIVTKDQIQGPTHLKYGKHDVWLRSHRSGLVSLPVDLLVLGPGVTDQQRSLAIGKTAATRGRVFELKESTL